MLNNNKFYAGLFTLFILFALIVAIAVGFDLYDMTNTKANNIANPVVTGDVTESDTKLINSALDDLATTQKEAQEQIKQLEISIATKKEILNNTVTTIITKAGKDWRIETVTEKDPKLRTYQFVKRDKPIGQPEVEKPKIELKEEEKK